MAAPKANNDPLIVIVSGGGPVGLTFTLHLTMMMGNKAKIIIYEGRWYVDEHGKMKWQGEQHGKTRRDQVVTLQDHVIDQMPEYVKRGLFKNMNERVWPTSRSITIREVEDRLLELIEPFVDCGLIELVPENLNEKSKCLIDGNFDALVGADGSNSFVRSYCNIEMISEGFEYACGVAYDIPNDAPEAPLHQALNCILSASQARYLVHSSASRRGHLNIRLIKREYDALKESLDEFKSRNETIDLVDTKGCPKSPIWSIIRQGLDFFNIPQQYVFRVVPIIINVRHASIMVRELRFEIKTDEKPRNRYAEKKFKNALAFLVGDAAMCVHFWPGRGMNSGMKAAMALARNIVRSCTQNGKINVQKPLSFQDYIDYEGFMARLRAREQQGRSLRVLFDSIETTIAAGHEYSHMDHCYLQYKEILNEKLNDTRQRMQESSSWPHKSYKITDDELRSASNRIDHTAVAQLSLMNPWATSEMIGADVCVEDTFKYDLSQFLPVPTHTRSPLKYTQSVILRQHFFILWILGQERIESVEKLIQEIEKYQTASRLSSDAEYSGEMKVVKTIQEAKEWLISNKYIIEQPHIRFKVVTPLEVGNNKTAIDAIETVRSESKRAPILIYPHTADLEMIKAALLYLNVNTADTEYEVKEFVGINQEAQWNGGYHVAHDEHRRSWTVKATQVLSTTLVTTPRLENPPKATRAPYPIKDPSARTKPTLPLPSSTFYISLPTTQSSDSSVVVEKETPSPEPLVIWIDSLESNVNEREKIKIDHPKLEIQFTPTISEAENYLKSHIDQLQRQRKLIVISRGRYQKESKDFTHVNAVFEKLGLHDIHHAVYTSDRASLLKNAVHIPRRIVIVDQSKDLFEFIARKLK